MNNSDRTFTIHTPCTDFGTWTLEADELVLKRQHWRRVDLERCNSSAQILDWIFHYRGRLAEKEMWDLLLAIEVILQPRANYCSCGVDKRTSGLELLNQHYGRFVSAPPVSDSIASCG
jgi:hypothetical protein